MKLHKSVSNQDDQNPPHFEPYSTQNQIDIPDGKKFLREFHYIEFVDGTWEMKERTENGCGEIKNDGKGDYNAYVFKRWLDLVKGEDFDFTYPIIIEGIKNNKKRPKWYKKKKTMQKRSVYRAFSDEDLKAFMIEYYTEDTHYFVYEFSRKNIDPKRKWF